MSTLMDQDVLNFKLINLKLKTDYSKTLFAILSSIAFSIMFYYIHVLIDSMFRKRNEKLSIITYQRYNGKINDPKVEAKKISDSLWMIKNLQISFIHSTLCALFIVYTVFTNPNMFHDPILYSSNECYLLVSFSVGYFIYDFSDMLRNNKIIEMWVVVAHHFIAISLFSYHLLNVYCLTYSLVALSMEFNSVFLHARKLLKLYGYLKTDSFYKVISFFNFLTFFVFRFGVFAYLYHDIYYDYQRLHKNYFILLITCINAMFIVNIGLFRQLLIKDIFRRNKVTNQEKTN